MDIFDYGAIMKPLPECDPEPMREALREADFPSCEYAYANLRMWAEAFRTRCGVFRGQMYFHMSNIDELLFPCGSTLPPATDLHAVSEGMKAAHFSGKIAHVPQNAILLRGLEGQLDLFPRQVHHKPVQELPLAVDILVYGLPAGLR